MVERDRAGRARGLALTGWAAVMGIAALAATAAGGAWLAWRRLRGGPSGGNTVVLKERRGYARVSTSAS